MLAYHYLRSDNRNKASHYLKLSGNKSIRNNALWEAYRSDEEALSVLRQMPESQQREKRARFKLFFLMTVPMRLLGYPEDSIDFLKEGETLCKELGDKRSLANLYNFMNLYYSMKGDFVLSRKYLEDTFVEADKIQDIEIMTPCAFGLCFSYLIEGNFIKVNNIAPKVIACWRRLKERMNFSVCTAIRIRCCRSLTGIPWVLLVISQGEQLCEKGIASAHRTNHPYSIGLAYYNYGNLCLTKGDGEKAIKTYQSAIEYQEKSQSAIFLATSWGLQGIGYYFISDYDKALKLLEKGIKMQMDMKLPYLIAFMQTYLSMAHFDLGDFNEANAFAEQAVKLAQANGEKWVEGVSWLQLDGPSAEWKWHSCKRRRSASSPG